MRCDDIDAIIDDHRIGALGAAERAAARAHLEECRRCTAAWLTNETLLREPLAAAPPGLLTAAVRHAEARLAAEGTRTARPWPALAAFAALAALLLVTVLFALIAPPATVTGPAQTGAGPIASTLIEGRDYRSLPAGAGAPERDASAVEVVQLFAYDCGPCYAFERPWAEWTERHRDDILLVRVPVQWNERTERFARAHYAAEVLGKADDFQLPLFEEIHIRGNPLESDDALAELFVRLGIERTAFDRAYGSPAVERAAAHARELVERYGVTGVPSLVIGGELVTTAAMAGSPGRLVEVVEALVRCVQTRPHPATANETRHC